MSRNIKFKSKMHHTLQERQLSIGQAVKFVVEDFLSTPLSERLEKLSDRLKSTDPELSESIRNVKAEFESEYWGQATCKNGKWLIRMSIGEETRAGVINHEDGNVSIPTVMFHVDAHIEFNLVNALRALLYQQMIEALVGANQTPEKYQEHMRHAAGLKRELTADTEKFLTRLHQRLYADSRKKWMNIHPGGSKSPLTKYQDALARHYERLHPIWKQAKRLYKKHGGGVKGQEAVKHAYEGWSPFIEGTLGAKNAKPEHIGLPNRLIAKLGNVKDYESSPEYLAYEHAAFLCNFKIGSHSVRQIKAVVRAHKRMLGTEYYNHTIKGLPMKFPGGSK